MATDNKERLEHAHLVVQMEAGNLALILASGRGLNIPQLHRTCEHLRTAIGILETIISTHKSRK